LRRAESARDGYGVAVYDQTAVQTPRRPGRTVAFVLGLALLACCVGGTTAAVVGAALLQNDNASTTTATNGAGGNGLAADGSPSVPTLNQSVRDGKFEFVVTAVSCGHEEIVNGFLRAQPQGRYCIVDLTVANIGTEPRHFADGNQRAYGPDGTQYAADTGAGVVANGNGEAWWNVINPGNSVAAKVVFDLPPAASIATLELHDSGFSGGVKVTVGPS
jgi:Domain of unknown function (DUF4352)